MRDSIKAILYPEKENKEPEVSEQKPGLNITPEQLQEILRTVLQENNRLNPLEQRELDEQLARDKKRGIMAAEYGYTEEMSRYNRQHNCTHSRHNQTGNSVPKGTGDWTTGGQVHSDDTITLICTRCQTGWRWQASSNEREYATTVGLLGFAPPPIERCLNRDQFVDVPPVRPDMEALFAKTTK